MPCSRIYNTKAIDGSALFMDETLVRRETSCSQSRYKMPLVKTSRGKGP